MDTQGLLAAIWKNKSNYNLIEEAVTAENTFMQQTSGHGNLWKTQLGVTENYLIVLKCEIDVKTLSCRLTNESRFIIHMTPLNRLKVKKCSGKRLQILFPNKCTCYFKLMPFHGCGSAWSKWKLLKDTCEMKENRYVQSHWALVPFASLLAEVQNFVNRELFLRPIIINLKFDGKERLDINPTTLQASEVSRDGKMSPYDNTSTRVKDMHDGRQARTSKNRGRRYSHRKVKQVNRFGEGIYEGCGFDLYLSCSASDDSSFEEIIQPSDLNTTKDNNIQEAKQDKSFRNFCGSHIAQKMALEYVHRLEAKVEAENRKEQTIIRIGIPSPSEESEFNNEIDGEVSLTLRIASRFLFSSPFFAHGAITKSQSVDSITQIGKVNFEHCFLTANLSLPNLDDMIFDRRNNRLSYSPDFEDDRVDKTIPISFWMPNKNLGNLGRGRIYSVNPLSQKSEVIRRRSIIRNLREEENEEVELASWSSSSTDDLTKKVLKEIESEYPVRHSLWTTSPDQKTRKSIEKSMKIKEMDEDVKCWPTKDTHSRKRFKDFNPFQLAQELREIQLILFCQIEDGEIARWMLKPKSVTEVNCPYLCGYIHFFERIESIVVSETLSEFNESEIADAICYFIQVAYYCFKKRDKQSSYAVLMGLCNPAVMTSASAWSIVQQHHGKELRIFQKLLNICWKETNISCANSNIPVFRSLVDMLYKTILKRKKTSSTDFTFRKLWTRFERWFSGENSQERSFINQIFCHLFTEKNIQEKKPTSRKIHHFEELLTSRYGHLEEVLTDIEECRQNYCFRFRSAPFQNEVRHLLLSKQYEDKHAGYNSQ